MFRVTHADLKMYVMVRWLHTSLQKGAHRRKRSAGISSILPIFIVSNLALPQNITCALCNLSVTWSGKWCPFYPVSLSFCFRAVHLHMQLCLSSILMPLVSVTLSCYSFFCHSICTANCVCFPPSTCGPVSLDARPVLIPILSSVVCFPIVAFAVICALRYRALRLRRKEHLRRLRGGGWVTWTFFTFIPVKRFLQIQALPFQIVLCLWLAFGASIRLFGITKSFRRQ